MPNIYDKTTKQNKTYYCNYNNNNKINNQDISYENDDKGYYLNLDTKETKYKEIAIF